MLLAVLSSYSRVFVKTYLKLFFCFLKNWEDYRIRPAIRNSTHAASIDNCNCCVDRCWRVSDIRVHLKKNEKTSPSLLSLLLGSWDGTKSDEETPI